MTVTVNFQLNVLRRYEFTDLETHFSGRTHPLGYQKWIRIQSTSGLPGGPC